MITRRELLAVSMASAFVMPAIAAERADKTLKRIHREIGGRLGVHALDSQSGKRIGYDERSRYAMGSTFKLALAAAILWQVDRKAFGIEHPLPISKDNLLPNSPAVEANLAADFESMTLRELCAAAVTQSDNTAANILLAGIGGPAALTTFFRTLGDDTTRLDRIEMELNSNLPKDPRDTTTPRAMVDAMLTLFTQDVLSVTSRALLIDWMVASKTGLDRVRAGIPKSWNPGDKSGTSSNSAVNDLVIAYPPERRPIFIAVYMSESKLPLERLNAAQAQIGVIIAEEMSRHFN